MRVDASMTSMTIVAALPAGWRLFSNHQNWCSCTKCQKSSIFLKNINYSNYNDINLFFVQGRLFQRNILVFILGSYSIL